MATTTPDRIPTLDIMRGLAVMGIFSVNVVGMAMIEAAYFYPPAYGFGSMADRVMWAANFILVDGKVRALFSILFGAGIVLVCERAEAAGRAAWRVHYPRMLVLLGFGLAHYYLLLWGDILANYALMGLVGFLFWRLPVERLLVLALIGFALTYTPGVLYSQQLSAARTLEAPGAAPEDRARVAAWCASLIPTPAAIAADKAAHQSVSAHARYMLQTEPWRPLESVIGYGGETLALMLLGMASYRSGFLTGSWPRRRYLQVAGLCIGASLLYFGASAWAILRAGFDPFIYIPLDQYWAGPLRPVAAVGYVAAIILLVRSGRLADRLAATGRMAFSNYLGATLVGAMLFNGYGLDLYGTLSRAEAWLFVPPVWMLMLWWSPWWLKRFRYGPLEWSWRSLARWRWEPLRRIEERQHA
ncbi:DUF418 domain-containing protein [Croceibacterium ferulae]|uniref:DUF418 domain-containing protein n=1 Tax=Croceibacterium ferulae TaxID=1854641 RepID=UPI000EACF06E|nr:DUF418 domain-containing protein [Croceibacterium ferulae]